MMLITLDIETFYASKTGYTLKKMMTDEYIDDSRFEVIGVSVKQNDGLVHWYTGTHSEIASWLGRYDWTNAAVCCHHTQFDGYIMAKHFGIRPKLWMDTLSMARARYPWLASHSLDALAQYMGKGKKGHEVVLADGKRLRDFTPQELAAYGNYCSNDVQLTYEIAQDLLTTTPPLELQLIDMTVRMFTEPEFIGDQRLLEDQHAKEVARKEVALKLAETDKDTIMSNPKFAAALRKLGVEPPLKISRTTNKSTYAFAKTDKEFTALLEHENPNVQAIVGARLGVKSTIAETRVKRFLDRARTGPLPVYLNYWGAKVSGRYSGGNKTNWQNLSARGPSAGIRNAIRAPVGAKLVVGDSANIELRVALACAGETEALKKLAAGEDLYSEFASRIFGRPITKKDKLERQLGKTACIAEGQPVLTPRGLVPIEQVTLDDTVWDGVEWVNHSGVIFNGYRETITYQGLTATPEHRVYLDTGEWSRLSEAAALEARIAVTGDGRQAIPLVDNHLRPSRRRTGVLRLSVWAKKLGCSWFYEKWKNYPVSKLRDDAAAQPRGAFAAQHRDSEYVGKTRRGHEESVYESGGPEIYDLRRPWSSVFIRVSTGVCRIFAYTTELFDRTGDRPHRQQWPLCCGEFAVYNPNNPDKQSQKYGICSDGTGNYTAIGLGKSVFGGRVVPIRCKRRADSSADSGEGDTSGCRKAKVLAENSRAPNSVRVYDILNCGPRNRFTVSNVLVHNCLGLQYGCGAERFLEMVRIDYAKMGVKSTMTFEEAERVVYLYRDTYFRLPKLWRYCGDVILPAIYNNDVFTPLDVNGWAHTFGEYFAIPGYPGVTYYGLRKDADGWVYTMGREEVRIYSSKVVENLCQYLARMIVMWQTARINRRYKVSLSVHDEVVCVVPDDEVDACREYMNECLTMAPPWCKDLPLACEIGVGQTYGSAK